MAKIFSMALVFVLALTVVACGGDDDDEPVAIEDASSCEQVMEAFFPLMQDMLDAVADLDMADFMSDDTPEPLVEFEADMEAISDKSDELNCSDEELSELLAEGVDDLEADGPVAELMLDALKTEGLD